MKAFLLVFVCLLSLSLKSSVQSSETFDLATFQPPVGWQKQSKEGVVIFKTSNQQKGTYAIVIIYRSGDSSGTAQGDFEADWQEFIVGQLSVKTKPEIEPEKNEDGWKLITGAAAFENDMGRSAVVLNTYSGYGKRFSAAAIFNSQDYLAAIEAFALSLKLRKPEARSTESPASNDTSSWILGTWQQSSGVQNPSLGVNNYIKRQYTFNADGTYLFYSKLFDASYPKLLLGRESGTYQISGNTLTINPKTSVTEAWSKNRRVDEWGARLNSQARPLEKVTYQFTRHYFSGIQTWSLVLQSSTPTERDGPFNGGSVFANAWLYQTPCATCLIKLPN